MNPAAMTPSLDPRRRTNVRTALILAAVALACYLGIYAYYVLLP
jgi:hypothetical protein